MDKFKKELQEYADENGLNILSIYKNGNFYVGMLSDGTRIMWTSSNKENRFVPDFAMNCDVKITNRCDANCSYCHEGSNCMGKDGDLNLPIFDTWREGTEMAIGGGNALCHPDLVPFLQRMRAKKVICNITINQKHIRSYWSLIQRLVIEELVHGIGVSLTDSSNTEDMKLIDMLCEQNKNNVVIHVINGIFTENDLPALKNKKVLILGYKDNIGRGVSYYKENEEEINKNMEWLRDNLRKIYNDLQVVSFDNLAIQQLDVKDVFGLSDEEWDNMYQGDDYGDLNGKYYPTTFYFDAVNKMIGRSSTQIQADRIPYDKQSFDECFKLSLKCLEK